ncbi:MAG: hypothetical protein Q4G42_02710 [Neisseria sp.]|nr:hypothetical protein [Neisseria sp.]
MEEQAYTIEGTALGSADDARLKNYVYAMYILYLCTFFFGFTIFIGVMLAYIKRNEMRGTPYAAHVEYLIATFWISLPIAIVGVILSLILIGFLVLGILGLWFVYRCLKGLIRLNDNKPL